MDDSHKRVLRAELYNAKAYLERLFHCITVMKLVQITPEINKTVVTLHFELSTIFEESILSRIWKNQNQEHGKELHFQTSKDEIHQLINLFDGLIAITNCKDANQLQIFVNTINAIYEAAYQIHSFMKCDTNVEILLPRSSLANLETHNGLTKLNLETEELINAFTLSNSLLGPLSLQREKRYMHYLDKGHNELSKENLSEALVLFSKASNYKQCAEIMTLIGWIHFKLRQIEKAKEYCKEAIRLDPEYGAAFNDLGNYHLEEGNIEEGLKWFEKAKNKPNYLNREYPYINAGRALIMQEKYEEALFEFSDALTYVPDNHELHETVEKVQHLLRKERKKSIPQDYPIL